MTRNAQVPNSNHLFDSIFVSEQFVVIIELRKISDEANFLAHWWVTGLNSAEQLVCVLQLQLVMPFDNEEEVLSSCRLIFDEQLLPLVHLAARSTGHGQLPSMFTPEFRSALLTANFNMHEQLGHIPREDEDKVVRIARQHQLAFSLSASTANEFIAAYDSIPVSTVKKRLERARAAGLLSTPRSLSSIRGRSNYAQTNE